MDENFILRCIQVLKMCNKRSVDFSSDYKDEINYLVSNEYIYNSYNGYSITSIGQKCLNEKWLEIKIEDLRRNNRLVEATEQSAKSAADSAKSARFSGIGTFISAIVSIIALIMACSKL